MGDKGCACTVLVADNFPELGTNLITTLTSLDVNDFAPKDDEKKLTRETKS